MPSPSALTVSVTTRLTDAMAHEVDDVGEELRGVTHAGIVIKRSDVIRVLVTEALEQRRKEKRSCATPPPQTTK